MRTPRRTACVVLLASAGLLGHAERATAQRQLRVEDFRVTLTVHPNGTMDVVESIRYGFQGSWNGVFRDIPVDYRTPSGLAFKLELDGLSARDETGSPYRFETSRERHYRRIKVWVPDARDASKTVEFRYTVKNPLRFFDGEGEGFPGGYDELYWNVTGDESEIPIDQASVTVHLPTAVTGVQAKAYTGPYGSTASDASITPIADGFRVESTRGLAPREGLTVDLAWDPGVIERPTVADEAVSTVKANWILLLPALSLALVWGLWRRYGKDPERLAVPPQYEPPEGMSPAEVGTLIDNRPHMRDITASIVDLAVRGYIQIEQRNEGRLFGLLGSMEYTFTRMKGEAGGQLSPFETRLLRALFTKGEGDRVKTEDLDNEFYKELDGLKDEIFRRLVEAGYYRTRPDRVIALYLGGAVAALVAMVALLISVAEAGGFLTTGSIVLAVVGSALPVLIFMPLMPRRTKSGTRRLEHILGFQEFLDRVEADHFRRMIDSPQMFERYLPYAMALGVEKRWARAFEDIYKEPPTWYVGYDGNDFSAGDFSRGMTSMSHRAGAAMTSQPRSSGGSGFGGGGGFSGGGSGGGGTGGF